MAAKRKIKRKVKGSRWDPERRRWISKRRRWLSKRSKRRIKKDRWPFSLKQTMVLFVFLLVVCVVTVVVVYNFLSSYSKGIVEPEQLFVFLPQLLTGGYSRVELDVAYDESEGIVMLTSGCRRIVAYVEPQQAESIYRGIKEILVARPNAHDIAIDTLNNFGINVIMVKITEVRDNAFYGKLVLKRGNKVVSLDSRPSDATAIAVRAGAPIYVKNDLLETHGEKIC